MYDTHLELAKNEFSNKPSYEATQHHKTFNDFVQYSKSKDGQFYLPKFAEQGGIIHYCYETNQSIKLIRNPNPNWQPNTNNKEFHCWIIFHPSKKTKYFNIKNFNKALKCFMNTIKDSWE